MIPVTNQYPNLKFYKGGNLKLLLIFLACLLNSFVSSAQEEKKPNIVFILIDDMGYGDLECYGSKLNRTPNINELAEHGLLFTDYHSNGPMCTPTRAAFLTGKYQYRFGKKFESALDGTRVGPDNGLPLGAFTLAEALRKLGYATGMYGKWHLGFKPPLLPFRQGFDDFWGLGSGEGDHFTHVDRSGYQDWWHNDTLKHEDGYSVDLITKHSVEFIHRHRNEPFFLYVPHQAIHFPWQGPNDPPHRTEIGKDYHKDKWGVIPDHNNVAVHIKAMVEAVDSSVGEIIRALKDDGLIENTIVVVSSDNGGYRNYTSSGYFYNISDNGVYRGQKMDVYEGGHRVPFIISWPSKIPQGEIRTDLIMTMDMFPSFITLAGGKIPKGLDGQDISSVWTAHKKWVSGRFSGRWVAGGLCEKAIGNGLSWVKPALNYTI